MIAASPGLRVVTVAPTESLTATHRRRIFLILSNPCYILLNTYSFAEDSEWFALARWQSAFLFQSRCRTSGKCLFSQPQEYHDA